MKRTVYLLIALFLTSTLFINHSANASWAYSFVVNDGNIYVISETQIESNEIGSKIGKVTKSSDEEGTYSGNFSNFFPKGTPYYKIKDIDINEAIAIKKSDGSFIKASYEGEYGGGTLDWTKVTLYIVGSFLLATVFILVLKYNRKRV